jgi:hypothetical protein
VVEVYNVNGSSLTIKTGPGGGEGTAIPDDDDLAARIAQQVANLITAFRAGHTITGLDPGYYRSYLRPVLCTLSDPDAARLMSELDRRL